MNSDQDALEQAADWQIRLQEEPQSRQAFERWLEDSEAHRAAWRQMEQLWGALGQLPARADPDAGQARSFDAPAAAERTAFKASSRTVARARRSRRWLGLALAAGLGAVAVLFGPQANLAWRADYQTGVGETRTVQLADGSSVVLGPQSALSVITGDARQVELLKGQAYFQVAPDPRHPFIARAGKLAVRVLGTAFDLDLQQNSAEVALEHGQVQAENSQPPLSERLMPGQRLRFSWPSGKVERSAIAPTQVASWRSGSWFVEDRSVAEIVEHLRRYTPGWIVVTDPALNARRITGVFDLNDPTRALSALAQSLGVHTRDVTPWVHTLGRF